MRALASLVVALPLLAQANVPALPDAVPAGAAQLRFFGLAVYDAQLWVGPGFRRSEFAAAPFALELKYRRGFRAQDIARRSIVEMERAGPLPPARAQQWEAQLRQVLPDVQDGDRLLGVHRPGRGAEFFHNGRAVGRIDDAEFAQRFFGIWLGPATSEPALRDALLAGTAP